MAKITKIKGMAIGLVVMAVALAIVTPQLVTAQDYGSSDSQEASELAERLALEQALEKAKRLEEERTKADQLRQEQLKKAREEASALSSEAKAELERQRAGFQKSCEARREEFKTRMEKVGTSGKRSLATMDAITVRIEEYVANSNLTVPNYQMLLTAVKTEQEVAQALVDAAVEKTKALDCTLEKAELQAQLAGFNDIVRQGLGALKDYKQVLKDLIKAVRTASEAKGETQ